MRTVLVAAVAVMCAGVCTRVVGQETQAGAGTPAQVLGTLAQEQQTALDSGDATRILGTSKHLAAVALGFAGALYAAEDKPAAAAEAYRRSLAMEESTEVRVQLITDEVRAGQAGEAAHDEAEMVRVQGDSMQTRMVIANAHHSADDLPGTVARLNEVVRLEPASPAAHLALGGAYWEINQFQYNAESLREFTEAQRLDPAAYLSNYDLGSVLSQFRRYAEAAPYLQAAAKADPASPDPWMLLGLNGYAEERMAEAGVAFGKAIALTGTDVAHNGFQIMRAFAAMSRIEMAAGHDGAAAELDRQSEAVRAQMLRENFAPTLSQSTGLVANTVARGTGSANGRGDGGAVRPAGSVQKIGSGTGASGGDLAVAAEQSELEKRLLEIAAKSLNDAGTSLARGRDYPGALPLFKLAAEVDGQMLPVMRNLGLALFHTERYGEAIAAFTKALQQDAGDAVAGRYLEQARLQESSAGASHK